MTDKTAEYPWQTGGDDVTILRVNVQPRSSRNQICGIHEGELKLKLTSPPVEGAANEACVAFLARLLKIPKSSINIISGETSRHKRLKIAGISEVQLLQLLSSG